MSLLVEWETLCSEFSLIGERACGETSIFISEDEESQEDAAGEDSSDSQEFEVEKFLGIRYGELPKSKKRGVMLKVSLLFNFLDKFLLNNELDYNILIS